MRIRLAWDIRLIRKQYRLKINFKRLLGVKRIFTGAIMVAAICNIEMEAKAVGVFDYIRESSNTTTLYEENYVNPEMVKLTFPEKKRNLILLYLESMETTYMDEMSGG